MEVKASEVTVGMRVWSNLLGEYFTVEGVVRKGNDLHFIEGVYTLRVRSYVIVEVEGGCRYVD